MEIYENTVRKVNKLLNELINRLIQKEPLWGHGNTFEFNMYTTRQILEMLMPIAKELSEISPNGEE